MLYLTVSSLLLLLLLQGLTKNDMITLVTGSHSIGGFHTFSSPGLTDCPYVPFDCTPAGKQRQQVHYSTAHSKSYELDNCPTCPLTAHQQVSSVSKFITVQHTQKAMKLTIALPAGKQQHPACVMASCHAVKPQQH
jgi:hypothetical protein